MNPERDEFYTKDKFEVKEVPAPELGFLPISKTKAQSAKEKEDKRKRESPKMFYTPDEVEGEHNPVIQLYFNNYSFSNADTNTYFKISTIIYHRIYLKSCKWEYIYVMDGLQEKMDYIYFN